MNRRKFIIGSASAVAGLACVWTAQRVYGAEDATKPARVRLGYLSDSHYANVDYDWAGDAMHRPAWDGPVVFEYEVSME